MKPNGLADKAIGAFVWIAAILVGAIFLGALIKGALWAWGWAA